jgi:hypothetical protein
MLAGAADLLIRLGGIADCRHEEMPEQTNKHPLDGTSLATVRTGADLCVMFRERIASLGITYETADSIAGLPAGYTAKLLAPTPLRRFGPVAIECLLGATGLKLLAVEDPETLARVKKRFVYRRRMASNRASPSYQVVKRTRQFMRQIGTLGGIKSGEVRRARALQKKAISEMKCRAALRRWRREPIGP